MSDPTASGRRGSSSSGDRPAEGQPSPERKAQPGEVLRCDFCGEPASSVRRVALDREYERLRTPHTVRFACPRCSEEKERERAARSGPS